MNRVLRKNQVNAAYQSMIEKIICFSCIHDIWCHKQTVCWITHLITNLITHLLCMKHKCGIPRIKFFLSEMFVFVVVLHSSISICYYMLHYKVCVYFYIIINHNINNMSFSFVDFYSYYHDDHLSQFKTFHVLTLS